MRRLGKIIVIMFCLLLVQSASTSRLSAQDVNDPAVEAILSAMSPEERVGQLFLITFYGSDASPESDVALLITRYWVGGVVLLAENNNFTDEEDLLLQAQTLSADLQRLASEQHIPLSDNLPGPTVGSGPYIPLFIGLPYEGQGVTLSQLYSGLTPLPSPMAIGATWEPRNAEVAGVVVGEELSDLGINLLLGVPADTVQVPHPFTSGDFGSDLFGGEAYWVSQMLSAYIKGVHVGSDGRVAVAPGHFPGSGDADRDPDDEVPTVRRSFDQLTQTDLKPFVAVTGAASDPLAQADGIISGHVKYLGFQGDNPRVPISLDQQSLQELLDIESIAAWHAGGGLVISDSLGSEGVRRVYEPQGVRFPNRQIAQDAFIAGNDILYVGDYGNNPESDQTTTVIDTIEFFVQAYNDDPVFQARVDDAVRRILKKKLALYEEFKLEAVLPDPEDLESIGLQSDGTLAVAQDSLTLLSPDQSDLIESPQFEDNVLIFTDTRTVQQCDTCAPQSLIPRNALKESILRVYGSEASGQVTSGRITSYTFEDLDEYIQFGPIDTSEEGETPEPAPLTLSLDAADWVIFVMLDVDPLNYPSSDVVKRFLADPLVSSEASIIVFAMDAPYYLDSTEIGKLRAYYGLYSYTEPFVNVAARALFQQASLNGASPVSISGLDYDILAAVSPDPEQVISLSYEVEQVGDGSEGAELDDTVELDDPVNSTATPTPTQTPVDGSEPPVTLGNSLRLSTGVIRDLNGNPVPDGTLVEYYFNYGNENLVIESAVTVDGISRITLPLDRPGELEITVRSILALTSDSIRVFIPENDAQPTIIVATPDRASASPPTDPPSTGISLTPEGPPAGEDIEDHTEEVPIVTFSDLFLMMIGLVAMTLGILAFIMRKNDINHALLVALPSAAFGLLGYVYYALGLPGVQAWRETFGLVWGAALAAWISALIGYVFVILSLSIWENWMLTISRDGNRR